MQFFSILVNLREFPKIESCLYLMLQILKTMMKCNHVCEGQKFALFHQYFQWLSFGHYDWKHNLSRWSWYQSLKKVTFLVKDKNFGRSNSVKNHSTDSHLKSWFIIFNTTAPLLEVVQVVLQHHSILRKLKLHLSIFSILFKIMTFSTKTV